MPIKIWPPHDQHSPDARHELREHSFAQMPQLFVGDAVQKNVGAIAVVVERLVGDGESVVIAAQAKQRVDDREIVARDRRIAQQPVGRVHLAERIIEVGEFFDARESRSAE